MEDFDFDSIQPTIKETLKKKKKIKIKSKEDAKNATKTESACGIWIGNLAFKTTSKDLRSFFVSCGTITRVHMPMDTGKNKGFAYVDFAESDALSKALALSETMLQGRIVLIKDAKDFEKKGRPKRVLDAESTAESCSTVFIGNLAFETTRQDLQTLLETYGGIKAIRLGTFEDTDKCKGYAHVIFAEKLAAEKAIKDKKSLKLHGKQLRMEYGKQPNRMSTKQKQKQEKLQESGMHPERTRHLALTGQPPSAQNKKIRFTQEDEE